MSAIRFPKADGTMIVLTEQVHASQRYTRQIRVSVRHVVAYWPTPDKGECSMKIEGRDQTIRVLASAEDLDKLIDSRNTAPLDLEGAS